MDNKGKKKDRFQRRQISGYTYWLIQSSLLIHPKQNYQIPAEEILKTKSKH